MGVLRKALRDKHALLEESPGLGLESIATFRTMRTWYLEHLE